MNSINTTKKYQMFKNNFYIKHNSCLFFFQSNKPKAILWKKNEQTLKRLQLTYYKILNKIVLNAFKNSIYKKFKPLINGVILVLKSKLNYIEKYETIKKSLGRNFNLLCLKLNNKIYSTNEVKNFSSFSYRKNVLFLYKSIEKYLKISYIICDTNSK